MMRMFKSGSRVKLRLKHPPSFQFRIPVRHSTTENKPVASLAVQVKNKVPYFNIANVKFVSDLKTEEHKQFHNKKRKRVDYEENQTAALALPYSQKQLEKKARDEKSLLEMSKNQIVEHANRRVDLFFYTLVAYYNAGVFPEQGHTYLQHGKGRNTKTNKNITQACHSSFIPALIDKTIYQSQAEEKHRSILDNTHFEHSLNATVELPSFVNELDDELENHFSCRQKSLEIIREVSLGTINPIQGLNKFLLMMRDAFDEIEEKTETQARLNKSMNMLFSHKHINAELVALVKKGTLFTTFSHKTQAVAQDYIQLLLRMTPEEKLLCENADGRNQIYLKKMKEIQHEILQSKHRAEESKRF